MNIFISGTSTHQHNKTKKTFQKVLCLKLLVTFKIIKQVNILISSRLNAMTTKCDTFPVKIFNMYKYEGK